MTLKGLRANVDMTQEDVAVALGLSREGWRNKEKGVCKLTFDEGYQLSELFKVPIEVVYKASKQT